MNLKEDIFIGVPKKIKQVDYPNYEANFFPSKIGGIPAWLVQSNPPQPICSTCNNSMKFLLQIYAPLELPHAFHRTLFIFACLGDKCSQEPTCIRVYRSQLPFENDYYAPSSNVDDEDDIAIYKKSPLAINPNLLLNKILYKIETYTADEAMNNSLMGEYLLEKEKYNNVNNFDMISDADSEDSKSSTDDYRHENELLKTYITNQKEYVKESDDIDKLFSELSHKKRDEQFEIYKKMTSYYNKQILRYCRSEETKPLWISDKSIPNISNIPNCAKCGSKRIFECQINSQILNLYDELKLLDWGVIAIYACEKSCDKNETYYEEITLLQFQKDETTLDKKIIKELAQVKLNEEEEEGIVVNEKDLQKPEEDDDDNDDYDSIDEQDENEEIKKKQIAKSINQNNIDQLEEEKVQDSKKKKKTNKKKKGGNTVVVAAIGKEDQIIMNKGNEKVDDDSDDDNWA